MRITIDVFIAKFYGHTGRRVAADSSETCSVEYDGAILIRAQEGFKRRSPAPFRPIGRLDGKVHRTLQMPCPVFPFLTGVHQKKAAGIF